MTTERLQNMRQALNGRTRLLRRSRRHRAAKLLAKDASLRALDMLLEVIMSGHDPDAANAAAVALSQHADWRHINVICSVWALTRHPTLGRLITQHGWIANAPPDARVLSALHTGQLDVMMNARPGLLLALLIACGDRNQTIAQRAMRSLHNLKRDDTKQALCMLAIEQNIPIALTIAKKSGYLPSDQEWRAVFLLLSNQREAYRALDPDCELTLNAYANSSAQLRERITLALHDEPQAPPLMPPSLVYVADLNDAQWIEAVQQLSKPIMHHVAAVVTRYAPVRWAARLLVHLNEDAEPAARTNTMPLDVLRNIAETCMAGKEPQPLLHLTLNGGQRGIHHLALSPDGQYLAASDGTGKVFVWNTYDGSSVTPPPANTWPIRSLIFSRDSRWLCSASTVGAVTVWDMHAQKVAQQYAGRAPLHLIPDSDTMMSGGDEAFHFWSLKGNHLSSIRTPNARIAQIALSDDGQYYAVAGSAPAMGQTAYGVPRDHSISVWRMPSGELLAGEALARWLDRGDPIARLDMPGVAEQIIFSPNGHLIAAVCGDGIVRVWRMLDGMLQQSYPGTAPIVFLQDGTQIMSGSATGGFQIRQSQSGSLVANVPLPRGIPRIMATIPSRGMVVGGSTDGTITLWRLHESLEAIELTQHAHRITALSLSADGRTLISADITGTVHVWDLSVSELIRRIPLHIRPHERTWISDVIRQRRYKGDERRWLELMNALYRTPPGNRRGFDPSQPIDIGSFRLRLE
jgi:WD40 repeat protein